MGASGSQGSCRSQHVLASQTPRKSITFKLRKPFSFTQAQVSTLTSTFLITRVFLSLTPHFARWAKCCPLPRKSGDGQSGGVLGELVKSCQVTNGESTVQGGGRAERPTASPASPGPCSHAPWRWFACTPADLKDAAMGAWGLDRRLRV